MADNRIVFGATGEAGPQRKRFWSEAEERGRVPKTWWDDCETTTNGTQQLVGLFAVSPFSNPKPTGLIQQIAQLGTFDKSSGIVFDFFAGSGTTAHAVINLNRNDGGYRKFILTEMANYFDTVLLPRLQKVTFTPEWKDGRPTRLATQEEVQRGPRVILVQRLESYEDTLNNLGLRRTSDQERALFDNANLHRNYLLHYMLPTETRGQGPTLNIQAFADPRRYTLRVKTPGSEASQEQVVDLIETFTWLLGLKVRHLGAGKTFSATFAREPDPDLPQADDTRLRATLSESAQGPWWIRSLEGVDPQGQKVLVIWRTFDPEKLEESSAVLEAWFRKPRIPADTKFDLIYVNGSNALPNIRLDAEHWKVNLIEEHFHRLMWDASDV